MLAQNSWRFDPAAKLPRTPEQRRSHSPKHLSSSTGGDRRRRPERPPILLVALGLAMLGRAHLLTGGIPGLAFLMSYATSWPLGGTLLIANLPFIACAWRVFGPRFTWKTIIVVAGLSLGVEGMGRALSVHSAHPLFAAIVGGLLISVDLLRHGANGV